MDEVVISIAGEPHWLWRAVDQNGIVLDVLGRDFQDCRHCLTLGSQKIAFFSSARA
jgi:hypothetical protein